MRQHYEYLTFLYGAGFHKGNIENLYFVFLIRLFYDPKRYVFVTVHLIFFKNNKCSSNNISRFLDILGLFCYGVFIYFFTCHRMLNIALEVWTASRIIFSQSSLNA